LIFFFFEILPSSPVGVSEVHLILGSTLFLLFGLVPTAFGLAIGLLAQGILLAPWDLPQYGMNVTTLLLPLFLVSAVAERIIPRMTAYQNLSYGQVLQLSLVYIVSWVAFWAIYGQGFGAENIVQVLSFGAAYLTVIVLEPLINLGLLAGVKAFPALNSSSLLSGRLFQPA
jgi:ABC-type Co2+ transport system permease subunit